MLVDKGLEAGVGVFSFHLHIYLRVGVNPFSDFAGGGIVLRDLKTDDVVMPLFVGLEELLVQKKAEEQKQLGWSAKRELAKLNYRIHTDAIKQNLVPPTLDTRHAAIIYANEADVLNVAMFGMTAKEWREANPEAKGNIRDNACINELICLSNLESLNAMFINDGIPQPERLQKLNQVAISQMLVLNDMTNHNLLTDETSPSSE